MRDPEREVTRLAFLLIRQFSLLSVASAVEPLRAANRLLGRQVYDWLMVSDDGEPAPASNRMVIAADLSLAGLCERLDGIDYLIVAAGLDYDPPNRARLHAGLHKAARAGLVLGSVAAGTYVLARAGLLDGHRCTIHWEYRPAFQEEFPDIDCTPGLYVIDRKRWTGAGGIVGMDMMLHLIEQDHGPALSRAVGNQFQVDRIRNSAIHQRPGPLERLETLPDPLQQAITLMMSHIEVPLKMEEVARDAGMNLRRMERMFQSHLKSSPAQFYRGLRLEKARELLLHSNLSTLEIGVLCGFSSSSHFAMAYSRHYGIRPSDERRPGAARHDQKKTREKSECRSPV